MRELSPDVLTVIKREPGLYLQWPREGEREGKREMRIIRRTGNKGDICLWQVPVVLSFRKLYSKQNETIYFFAQERLAANAAESIYLKEIFFEEISK